MPLADCPSINPHLVIWQAIPNLVIWQAFYETSTHHVMWPANHVKQYSNHITWAAQQVMWLANPLIVIWQEFNVTSTHHVTLPTNHVKRWANHVMWAAQQVMWQANHVTRAQRMPVTHTPPPFLICNACSPPMISRLVPKGLVTGLVLPSWGFMLCTVGPWGRGLGVGEGGLAVLGVQPGVHVAPSIFNMFTAGWWRLGNLFWM